MADAGLFTLIISCILVNNFVLSKFLGICPFVGVSKQIKPAMGMGFAVIFVMTIAATIGWVVYRYLLVALGLEAWRTLAFILVIASLVQLVEMIIQKFSPVLYEALGIYLPLITTNCAVLGVVILNTDQQMGLLRSVVQGFASGVGFLLVLVLMAGMRERLELADVPICLKGLPITFILAGLMSIAFLGFAGMLA
jgi:H+/Na+-translocating ferredoxin:NAD+ oxidoreductase subunit A